MNKPELLAPAGCMDSLTAALRCGADAVYIGGKSFSARQNAANFNFNELNEAVRLCHLYGKKLYMTVNTIIFDSQAADFAETIENALYAGVDAFIVQDWGAAEIIKAISPDSRLHASTQMTIHSPAGALAAKKLGFKRAVLSRELSQKQIKEISALDIETEIFVHGALCMSVSGQCYLSALIGQRSANRGLCAQPCRLPFSSSGIKEYCGLSLKDLSLAEHIKEIENSGVTSLKIEGRMKRPEYVAAAVSAFRNALDGGTFDADTLRAVFSRSGFTDGYFTGSKTDMFGTRQKEDVTAAKKVFPEIHKLYRTERKISGIHFTAEIKHSSPVKVSALDSDGNSVTVEGNIPEAAQNKPIGREFLERQLSKLGGTVYNYDGLNAEIEGGLAVGAGELNEVRRKAVSEMNAARVRANTPKYSISGNLPEIKDRRRSLSEIRARISEISQLESAMKADYVIVPLEALLLNEIRNPEKIIIEPPRFIANEQETSRRLAQAKELGIIRLMCNNIAYLHTGKELGFILHGDFGLNVSNSYSANLLSESGMTDLTLSFELKASQAAAVKSPVPAGIIAYGRLPVMLTANCPVKNETGCKKCRKELSDRTGRSFSVVCHGQYAEILNSQKLYLADRLEEFKGISFMTLYFTDESPEKVSEIIHDYRSAGNKKENITRGLYYRGIL